MSILQEVRNERMGKIPLKNKIYRNILSEILTEKLIKGQKLTEPYLCNKYGSSRTPVREALHRLETTGIIEYIPNKGWLVHGFSKDEIDDIVDFRIYLEGKAVQLAIERITDDYREELAEIFSYMEFYTRQDDIKNMIDINNAFHRIIYRASQNTLLERTLISYQLFMQYCLPSNYFIKGYLKDVLEEHRKVYLSFQNMDPKAGREAMIIHMLNSKNRRL